MALNPTRFPNGIAGPIVNESGEQAAAIAALTDNSGGAATDTIAAITEATNAGSADIAPVKNAIASLTAKINAINAALLAAGITA